MLNLEEDQENVEVQNMACQAELAYLAKRGGQIN